jgi:hypothetical protein
MDGISPKETELLTQPDYESLMRHAISFSDGVVETESGVNPQLLQFGRELKKPVLELQPDMNTLADACSEFYDEVLLGESVAELAE